ncbi:UNVERIFIED_CONTAM: hypothetical protein Sangu_0935600 [Sesamum angustifolium]|uniref:Uncharacterized protein n=1 Tax=Sesamum angustifolium TaxID=2727405 RepID=A0AAW2PEZ9_9LAMI
METIDLSRVSSLKYITELFMYNFAVNVIFSDTRHPAKLHAVPGSKPMQHRVTPFEDQLRIPRNIQAIGKFSLSWIIITLPRGEVTLYSSNQIPAKIPALWKCISRIIKTLPEIVPGLIIVCFSDNKIPGVQ